MRDLELICPDCRSGLISDNNKLYCGNNHSFPNAGRVYNLLPHSIDKTTLDDAIYHESQKEDWIELNQITSLRNTFFHKKITDLVAGISSDESNILEIAGGAGYDMELFLTAKPAFNNYVISEISEGMLSYVSKKVNQNNAISYCCLDCHKIPFEKKQFDVIYMVAALHHFSDLKSALEEIVRVTKNKGFIIFGIEPNRNLFIALSKLAKSLRKIMPRIKHSPSDEKTDGFTDESFTKIAAEYNLRLLKLEPVWFACGFLHYGLEFIFRLFRLKKRIQVPAYLERLFIYFDNWVFFIPLMKKFCWHYTAVYQKNERD